MKSQLEDIPWPPDPTANSPSLALVRKLHFTEVARYEAWGAAQWLGVWTPPESA